MSQPILLLNCGSSSIKYQLLDPAVGVPQAVGIVQRIGQEVSTITHEVGEAEYHDERPFANHTEAVAAVVAMFRDHGPSLAHVTAVGHRVVHGGAKLVHSTLIDDGVVAQLEELSGLAPLHNPPAIAGIRGAQEVLPDVPHVAIFDTAFFGSLPPEAYTYAIDIDLAAQHGIRKYGFHGTSHSYVSRKVAEVLGKDYSALNQIVCHLGNGASISAIKDGQPVETSMGLTPLQGLMMGTRSGDIDPGIHAYLYRSGMTIDEIDNLLNKKSGLLGMSGSNDMRDVGDKAAAGDEAAQLALDVYVHRLVSYIGSYMAILGGVDAVAFTAGVGENAAAIREAVVTRLHNLGFHLDAERNAVRSKEPRLISTDDSPVKVLVVPTNEELQMAREVKAVVA